MPCLVAAPTVVPYHAGQEEYFNGLLVAILRNSRASRALTLLVLAVAISFAPNVRAEEGGACLSPGQSEKLTYHYQAGTSHHLTVTGRSNPNAQFAIFVTDGAGIIVAEGYTDSGNVQLTWKAQVTEDFTIAVMNNSNATGTINFEMD
jgi:membrane-bound inhibitor of C-type lysozyme